MSMIQCPKCGKDISDKSKKCIHCGEVMIEEVKSTKYCTECGKKISAEAKECIFCGYPIEPEKTINAALIKISEKVKKNKKPFIIIAVIIAVAIIIGLVCNFVGSILTEEELIAYQNAVEMKEMMRDPDSFKLYDEMILLKHFDENGENDYTYTIFKYAGTNGYGATVTEQAIFKGDEYIMDYADDPNDEEDPETSIKQWLVQRDIAEYRLIGDCDEWQKVDINVEKIKDKMGLK